MFNHLHLIIATIITLTLINKYQCTLTLCTSYKQPLSSNCDSVCTYKSCFYDGDTHVFVNLSNYISSNGSMGSSGGNGGSQSNTSSSSSSSSSSLSSSSPSSTNNDQTNNNNQQFQESLVGLKGMGCCSSCIDQYYFHQNNRTCYQFTCDDVQYSNGTRKEMFWYWRNNTCVEKCGLFASYNDPLAKRCVQNCTNNQKLDTLTFTCREHCPNGTYYSKATNKCYTECKGQAYLDQQLSFYSDKVTKNCVKAQDCSYDPILKTQLKADNITFRCTSKCTQGTFYHKQSYYCIRECYGKYQYTNLNDKSDGRCSQWKQEKKNQVKLEQKQGKSGESGGKDHKLQKEEKDKQQKMRDQQQQAIGRQYAMQQQKKQSASKQQKKIDQQKQPHIKQSKQQQKPSQKLYPKQQSKHQQSPLPPSPLTPTSPQQQPSSIQSSSLPSSLPSSSSIQPQHQQQHQKQLNINNLTLQQYKHSLQKQLTALKQQFNTQTTIIIVFTTIIMLLVVFCLYVIWRQCFRGVNVLIKRGDNDSSSWDGNGNNSNSKSNYLVEQRIDVQGQQLELEGQKKQWKRMVEGRGKGERNQRGERRESKQQMKQSIQPIQSLQSIQYRPEYNELTTSTNSQFKLSSNMQQNQ